MTQSEKDENDKGLGRLTTGRVRGPRRLIWLPLAVVTTALAHPIPDIPVRAFFQANGSVLFQVEIDTRCFDADPEMAPYLLLEDYLPMPEAERERLRARALEYVRERVEIVLQPGGTLQPEWQFEFTTFRSSSLAAADDPVMLTGSWRLEHLADFTGYQLRAPPQGELSVLFLNYYEGDILNGIEVLFPGESSSVLDLTDLENAEIGDPHQDLIEGISSPGN